MNTTYTDNFQMVEGRPVVGAAVVCRTGAPLALTEEQRKGLLGLKARGFKILENEYKSISSIKLEHFMYRHRPEGGGMSWEEYDPEEVRFVWGLFEDKSVFDHSVWSGLVGNQAYKVSRQRLRWWAAQALRGELSQEECDGWTAEEIVRFESETGYPLPPLAEILM